MFRSNLGLCITSKTLWQPFPSELNARALRVLGGGGYKRTSKLGAIVGAIDVLLAEEGNLLVEVSHLMIAEDERGQ
jgi:hypothetical protein